MVIDVIFVKLFLHFCNYKSQRMNLNMEFYFPIVYYFTIYYIIIYYIDHIISFNKYNNLMYSIILYYYTSII